MKETVGDTEKQLLSRMARDDQAAFASLYRRHWEPLFINAARVIGSKEDAQDIIQEVFATLWRRRKELSLTGPLAAYLQASVKYKVFDHIGKNITRRNYLATLGNPAELTTPASAEVLLGVKETQELIHTVIVNMPDKMRQVYQLSRHDHLTHKEIAARLGISEETVKKHIQHALQLLRTALVKKLLILLPLLL